MSWPIDDRTRDLDAAQAVLSAPIRERLALERRLAERFGFACFADYFADRRARAWGLDRLAHETGQTRDWVRGVMRRYGRCSAGPEHGRVEQFGSADSVERGGAPALAAG